MTRLTSTDRLRRLIAVIPWVHGRGEVPLAEIAERFDYPVSRLRKDLTEVLPYVGAYPYSPDNLIEVWIDGEEDRVSFNLAHWFSSPLRLTPVEALNLLSAGMGLLGSSTEGDAPLERALRKLADRFGLTLGEQIMVSLGSADAEMLDLLRQAANERRCVQAEYHSLHRGETSDRVIEPLGVFSQSGEWYLRGWCRRSDGLRTFRVDRMLSLEVLDETFDRSDESEPRIFAPTDDDLRVTLDLAPPAEWVAEVFPVETDGRSDAGHRRVTLVASSERWLERLLLQTGPHAQLVSTVPALGADPGARAARRLLERYSSG